MNLQYVYKLILKMCHLVQYCRSYYCYCNFCETIQEFWIIVLSTVIRQGVGFFLTHIYMFFCNIAIHL